MSETVLVIGAGIAGLSCALALGRSDRQVVVVERDGPPPPGGADEAFVDWKRTGVGHLRQSHAFLARLRNVIRDDHPQLLADLAAAGVRDLTFESMLSGAMRKAYVPRPEDAELTIITSRRTTLELVMRRYVETLPNVTLRPGVFVRRLEIDRAADGARRVTGVRAEEGGREIDIRADVVVDAGGKGADLVEQLREAGADVPEFSELAGILYFTRHYRLRPGRSEPARDETAPPPSGDLGFFKFGIFPGDNGCFSVTVCTPEIEYEMRKAVMDPQTFQAITMLLPGLARWTNPEQAEPTSKVFGMGDLICRWRDLVVDGTPAALGYFAVGDNLTRTNPLYGRGCSFAAVAAYRLREALDGSRDPLARARAYHAAVGADLRPFFDLMLKQDRDAIKRARRALTPGHKPTFGAKLAKSFAEDGIAIAVRQDIGLLRQAMRGFHMLEHPEAWLKRPRNLLRVIRYWARGKKANAAFYPPKPGPRREEMMRALGLDHEADVRLAAAEAKLAA